MKSRRRFAPVPAWPLAAMLLLASAGLAQPTTATGPAPPGGQPPGPAIVSRHSIMIADRRLTYTAAAGFLPIRDEAGKIEADVFYTAYVLDGQESSGRALTFAFNGGPGAASLWLHLGAMGPRRVLLADDGKAMPRDVRLVDNAYTWLDFTDLVFIDPVGSGYSTAAEGIDAKRFYGLKGDVRSVGEFIRAYVSREGRWTSPRFLAGESYGTTRAAGLARYLSQSCGMNLDGLVLLSSALSFQTFRFDRGNDLACLVYLPTYTAVAWYHHKLAPELQRDLGKALAEAERWAVEQYAPALARGDELPAEERKKTAAALARLTGLDERFIEAGNLRVPAYRFVKELLRSEGKVVGTLDGRVTGLPLDPAGNSAHYDPAMFIVTGPFTAAIQAYFRDELGFRTDRPYVFLSRTANQSWDWGSAGEGYVDVTGELFAAMTKDPGLKVFAGMGYFDVTTGYFAQQYTFNHLGLAPSPRGNLTVVRYPTGHQIYNHVPSLRKLTADVAAFVKAAAGPDGP